MLLNNIPVVKEKSNRAGGLTAFVGIAGLGGPSQPFSQVGLTGTLNKIPLLFTCLMCCCSLCSSKQLAWENMVQRPSEQPYVKYENRDLIAFYQLGLYWKTNNTPKVNHG